MLKHKERMLSYSEYGKMGAEKRWGGDRGANGGGNAKRVKREERNRGKGFSADGTQVVFPDGSSQLLGQSQLIELKHGTLNPRSIYRDSIY